MSDETKKPETTAEPDGKTFTQSQLEEIIGERLARERKKYSDYDELKAQLEAKQKEEEERKKAEMTEIERLKAEKEELAKKYEMTEKEKAEYQKKIDAIRAKTEEKVNSQLEGLTESQKKIVTKLPLEDRLDAIAEFKATKKPGEWGKGTAGESSANSFKDRLLKAKTLAEREAILREKYQT